MYEKNFADKNCINNKSVIPQGQGKIFSGYMTELRYR